MLNKRLQLCKSSKGARKEEGIPIFIGFGFQRSSKTLDFVFQRCRQRNQLLRCSFTKGMDKISGHLWDCGGCVWGGGGLGVVCRNEMELGKLVEVVISTTHPVILTDLEFPARKRAFS